MSPKKFSVMHILTQLFLIGGQVTIICTKLIYVLEGVEGQVASMIGSMAFLVGTVSLFYILDPIIRSKNREVQEQHEAKRKAPSKHRVIRSNKTERG